ncbi:MAG: hypothetical protein HYZ27_05925, partial [Deltaproteobacteria bacterium]|nr:hypothetical protein [Deltaproteobacteria bacterium]
MTPPSRWLLATAVLFAGVSVLAAALRERGQVPARAAHAPRPEAAPAVEEPETP